MISSTLSANGIDPKRVCQVVTTKYRSLNLFAAQGKLITKLKYDDEAGLFHAKLDIMDELILSEKDPRKFLWTTTDDIIRVSYIAKMQHIKARGITFFNSCNDLILFFEDAWNMRCELLIEAINDWPTIPEEGWCIDNENTDDEYYIYHFD